MGRGSSANSTSRPARVPRTTPASSSTRRCLVTAWRVNWVPSVSLAMDCGSPLSSFDNTARRVSSPRAANTLARTLSALSRLGRLSDMALDVLDLLCPAALIHAEGLVATVDRNFVEAGFDDAQQRAGLR